LWCLHCMIRQIDSFAFNVPRYITENIHSLNVDMDNQPGSVSTPGHHGNVNTPAQTQTPAQAQTPSLALEQPTKRQIPLVAIETIINQLEKLVSRLGLMTDDDCLLSRSGLQQVYVLDLIDRIVMRVYALHEDIRALCLFNGSRHAHKYTQAELVALCARHQIQTRFSPTTMDTAQLCDLLGHSNIVESTPSVRVHLYQTEVSEHLARIFVPHQRLPPAALQTSARYVAYVNCGLPFAENKNGSDSGLPKPQYHDGMGFASDLVRIIESLQFIPMVEVQSLLAPRAGRDPRNILYLIDALAVKLYEDDEKLIELACAKTPDSDFLLDDLKVIAAENTGINTKRADKAHLCSVLWAPQLTTQFNATENPFLRLRTDKKSKPY
jgi:hypothetical protein